MVLLFVAVGYTFTKDDKETISKKMGDSADIFSNYMDRGLVCLEESGDNLKVWKCVTTLRLDTH